jgi:hypothetical protein
MDAESHNPSQPSTAAEPYPLAFIANEARDNGPWEHSRDTALDQRLALVLNFFGPNNAIEVVTTERMASFVQMLSERQDGHRTILASPGARERCALSRASMKPLRHSSSKRSKATACA